MLGNKLRYSSVISEDMFLYSNTPHRTKACWQFHIGWCVAWKSVYK